MVEKTADTVVDQAAAKVAKTEAEWKAELTSEQFKVCRHKGTERAFSGAYWNTKTPGMYLCACCGQELFSSETKFDSGTGWPSFWQPVDAKAIGTESDRSFFMSRAPRCIAAAAARTWATSSRTDPSPPASGTASTRWRSSCSRRKTARRNQAPWTKGERYGRPVTAGRGSCRAERDHAAVPAARARPLSLAAPHRHGATDPLAGASARQRPDDAQRLLLRPARLCGADHLEATQVSMQGQGYAWTPGIHSREQVDGWRLVTDAVHAAGGRIFLQLWHVGRISHASLQPDGMLPVAPSAIVPPGQAFTRTKRARAPSRRS